MRAFLAAVTIASAVMTTGVAITPFHIPAWPTIKESESQRIAILGDLDSYVAGQAGEGVSVDPQVDHWQPPMRWRVAAADLELRSTSIQIVSGRVPLPRRKPPGSEALLALAQADVGKGPRELGTRLTLWCADAINVWLRRLNIKGTGSALAASFVRYGKPADPAPGVIAVKPRRGGSGHVVIVKSVLPKGRMLVVSPNGGGNKVRLTIYPIRSFYAFRAPV